MFTCACVEPDYILENFVSKTVKARKNHFCCECGCEIIKGTKYECATGVGEDGWETYKTCLICEAIANDFMSCGRVYGDLWETLRYTLDSNDPDTPEFDWLSSK